MRRIINGPPVMPRGPHYWPYETSGILRPVIEAYLAHQPLDREQVAILRDYLVQWIMAPVWDHNPHADMSERRWLNGMRLRAFALMTQAEINAWVDDAVDGGLDPL